MEITVKLDRKKGVKCTAANGRFGVMAAVAPQKWQCKFETLYPAGSVVEAATTPSRWDVRRQRGTARWKMTEKLTKKYRQTKC